MNSRFWLQEQAPAGNWFDSVGFQSGTVEQIAFRQLADWRKTFPNRKFRLVSRVDTVVAEQKGGAK